MTKNTLEDLQNHLFAALERLSDDDLDDAGIEREIERSAAIAEIGKVAIQNASTAMRAVQMRAGLSGAAGVPVPRMLGGSGEVD